MHFGLSNVLRQTRVPSRTQRLPRNLAAYAGNGSASVSAQHILETETVMGADHNEASFGSLAVRKSASVNEHLLGACNGTLLDRGSGFRNLGFRSDGKLLSA